MNERVTDGSVGMLERDVERAKSGDRAALESVVHAVQKDVYTLAIRFLWHPQDAEDATQEILIRVITGLAGFQGASHFRTWVYRVACNALLTLKKQRMERQSFSFEQFASDLAEGLSMAPLQTDVAPDQVLLLEEVKLGCTLAMLQCLDRDHRLAYILGELLELDHVEAAEVLEITASAFRKRLSRSRARIISFMTSQCGLINPVNACRCHRRVKTAIQRDRVNPSHLLFVPSPQRARQFPQVLDEIRQLEESRRAAALFRSHPEAVASGAFISWLKELLKELPDRVLNENP